jgi:hypothetical protein
VKSVFDKVLKNSNRTVIFKSKSGIVYKIDKKTGKIKVKKTKKLKSKKNRKPNPFERKKKSLERVPELLKSNET